MGVPGWFWGSSGGFEGCTGGLGGLRGGLGVPEGRLEGFGGVRGPQEDLRIPGVGLVSAGGGGWRGPRGAWGVSGGG